MAARRLWRWILAVSLGPAASMAAYGCAVVGGIEPPAPTTCPDGKQNGDETSVDCGGSCGACNGDPCVEDGDCASGICDQSVCSPPTNKMACPDGRQDVRCQACHTCGLGATCVVDADCVTGLCKGHLCATCGATTNPCADNGPCVGSCLDVTCINGVRDGDEEGIDCGGSCAKLPGGHACTAPTCGDAGCADGDSCLVDADCASMKCEGKTCVSCSDGKKNQDETGVDCGGVCIHCTMMPPPLCTDGVKNGTETDKDCGGGACDPCDDGLACGVGADCKSDVCNASVCAMPICSDGVKNGMETDEDCGGGGPCDRCIDGKLCAMGSDCLHGVCTNGHCAPPTCVDGVKNGDETGIDCGNVQCHACDDSMCTLPGDCASLNCHIGICRPASCTMCTAGSTSCGKCSGEPCVMNADCFSNECVGGTCV
jgi:hypothetical protein